jgi:hypothetical protein
VSVWSLRDWRRGGVAIWYAMMLVPAALTITLENPSAIRAIGALPPVYLLAGMAVATTYRAIAPMRNGAMLCGAIAVLLVGSSAAINYYDLFERQAKDQAVYDGFEPYYRQVGEAVADEGVNARDAIGLIERDHFVLWSDMVDGRATAYLYLLAGAFRLFGYNLFALRIVPVAAGFAAVVAFYFLARALIGVVPALVATALLAVSRWATTFSRISWEASLVPVLEIASAYFLFRAIETQRRIFFVLAGVSLVAGLYTYVAFRMVPVVLLMFLAYMALTQWRMLARNVPGIAIYAATFFVVVAPLAWFAFNNLDSVLERTRSVNVFRVFDD